MVRSMMESVIEDGTGRSVRRFGVEGAVGGKTGTTDNEHDAWFVGFAGDVVVAVWVGFDRGQDLGLTGSQGALPTWSRFVARSGLQAPTVPPPDGITMVSYCTDTREPADCAQCEETVEEPVFSENEPQCEATSPLRDAVSRMLQGIGEDDATETEAPKESGRRRGIFGRRNN